MFLLKSLILTGTLISLSQFPLPASAGLELAQGVSEEREFAANTPFAWIIDYLFSAPDEFDTKLRVWAATEQYAIATYLWDANIAYVLMAKNPDGIWEQIYAREGSPANAHTLMDHGISQDSANELWQAFVDSRNHFYSVF